MPLVLWPESGQYVAEGEWHRVRDGELSFEIIAGQDLNQRRPGYEMQNLMLSAVESVAPEAKIPPRDQFWQLKCNHVREKEAGTIL